MPSARQIFMPAGKRLELNPGAKLHKSIVSFPSFCLRNRTGNCKDAEQVRQLSSQGPIRPAIISPAKFPPPVAGGFLQRSYFRRSNPGENNYPPTAGNPPGKTLRLTGVTSVLSPYTLRACAKKGGFRPSRAIQLPEKAVSGT